MKHKQTMDVGFCLIIHLFRFIASKMSVAQRSSNIKWQSAVQNGHREIKIRKKLKIAWSQV